MTYLERFSLGDAQSNGKLLGLMLDLRRRAARVDVQRDMNDFMECCTMGESPQPGEGSKSESRTTQWMGAAAVIAALGTLAGAADLLPPASSLIPIGSMCFGGLKVTRPRRKAVSSPEAKRDQSREPPRGM
jgi:hypothetical protein